MGARNLVAGTGHSKRWAAKSFQPMKPDGFLLRCVLGACLLSLAAFTAHAAVTNVFSTQFESAEGYDPALDLVGQLGWDGSGTGGNGLASGFITNRQQHAYIGYAAPLSTNEDSLVVWKPIDFNPLAANRPIVTFSTLMQISDSVNSRYDNFRWSVYNTQAHRLFSIDFDNYFLDVNYLLDGTNQVVVPGFSLTNDFTYALVVTMNFASNRWSASLNGTLLTTNQPITTTGARLDLGDVDAVWIIHDPTAPGDNLMVFDDYRITAESIPVPPAQMHLLGRTSQGWALLQVSGQNGSRWSVDATTNLVTWTALKTNTISETFFDFVDTTAAGLPRRFYRARLVP